MATSSDKGRKRPMNIVAGRGLRAEDKQPSWRPSK